MTAIHQPSVPDHQRLAEQLTRLQEVTSALAGARSEEAIGDVIVEFVVPALGADGGVLALVTAAGQLKVARSVGYGEEYAHGGVTYDLEAEIPLTEAVRTKVPVSFSSAEDRGARFADAGHIQFKYQSMLAAPLLLGDDTIGVIALTFLDTRAFARTDEVFLATVAQQCAVAFDRCRMVALERARLVSAQEEARVLGAVQQAGSEVVGELELRRLLQTVTDAGRELSGAGMGVFFYRSDAADAGDGGDPDASGEGAPPQGTGGRFELYALSGINDALVAGLPTPRPTALLGPALRGEATVRVGDVTTDPRFGSNPPFEGFPMGHPHVRSLLAVPVISRAGVVHGAMLFGHAEPERFTYWAERLVVGVAAHAAIAIDNARLYEEQQQARARAERIATRLRLLQRLTSALSGAVTVDDVIAATTREAATDLHAPGRGIWLLDDRAGVLRLAPGSSFGGVEDALVTIPLQADVVVADVARTGEAIFVDWGAAGSHGGDDRLGLRRDEAFAAIPLLVEGRAIGVVAVGFSQPRRFDDADRQFFISMANQCAQALERAYLYEREHALRTRAEEDRLRAQRMATALQTSLLPPELPPIPNVELDARYHAAVAGMDVGGDFYDVFDTGGDWAVVMGDVVGKGPEAAALTALARYTLRSLAMDLRQPARILRRLNEALILQSHEERFCTVAYARVVPTVNGVRLAVCLGGHPPPLVLRATGEVETVGAPGGLIGLFHDIRLWEETVQLGPGDAVCFFTDGVTEAACGGEEFGDEGVAAVLRSNAGASAAELTRRIEEAVVAFGGPEPRDDLAILVMRVLP
jgi:GAF domain-containing protein